MPRKIPPALGATLRFLRFSRGWTGGDLAQAVQASPPLISDYEKGVKTLSRERLEGLIAPMNVPPEAIDAALLALELLDPDEEVPPNPGDPTPEERRRIGRAAARIGAGVAREIRAGLTAAVRAGRLEEDRRRAGEVWNVLRQLAPKERKIVVDVAGEHLGWAVCERLCEESTKAGADKAERAVELAELALRVAERNMGPERAQLQGYAWAFVGNARRIQGNLPRANEAFRRSHGLWQAGEAVLDKTRIFDLEASLRQHQGSFEEAIALLDRALTAGPTGESLGRLLVKKANIFEIVGKHTDAIDALHQAARSLGAGASHRLVFAIRFNLVVNLSLLGKYTEAYELLADVRELALNLGNGLDLVRVLWLEGRIVGGLGQRREAVTALEQVRGEFASQGIAYDAALVSLELAVLLLEDDKTREVKEMATQLLWIFRSQEVHSEALAALRLFYEAAESETATVNMTRRILDYLEKARHAPELRFGG